MTTILRKMTEQEYKFATNPEQKKLGALVDMGKEIELIWDDPYKEAILLLGYVIEEVK